MGTFIDLTGQKFGRLTVISEAPSGRTPGGMAYIRWNCQCECGTFFVARAHSLRCGDNKSCGCLYRERVKDLTGQQFGRLTVVSLGTPYVYPDGRRSERRWTCVCQCGTRLDVVQHCLIRGATKSCGCLSKTTDLVGRRFGILTVVARERTRTTYVWACRCDCGCTTSTKTSDLVKGRTKSCGCLNWNDLTGQQFGRLTVIALAPSHIQPNGKPSLRWHCICECGTKVVVRSKCLRAGETKSCGCIHNTFDLVGHQFGRLTVTSAIPTRTQNGQRRWLCKCWCGGKTIATTNQLNFSTRSCGCLVREACATLGYKSARDIVGQKIGRLTVIERAGSYSHGATWRCLTDAGHVVTVNYMQLCREEITDEYLRNPEFGLRDAPPELLELKREQLKLRRLAREAYRAVEGDQKQKQKQSESD